MNKTTSIVGYPQSSGTTTIDSLANAQYFAIWMGVVVLIPFIVTLVSKVHESCCIARAFKG